MMQKSEGKWGTMQAKTMSVWRRYWIDGFIVLTGLLGVLSTVTLAQEIGHPFGGYISYRSIYNDFWHVDVSTPSWWPGLTQSSLDYQLTLLEIEGYPYGSGQKERFAAAQAQGDRSITLLVAPRGGREAAQTAEVAVIPFTFAHFLDVKTPEIISGIVLFVLAIIVYHANPGGALNRTFALLCILTAGYRWMLISTLFLDTALIPRLLELALIAYAAFVGPFLIRFALLFPKPARLYSALLSGGLYLLGFLTAATYLLSRLLWWQSGPLPAARWADQVAYASTLYSLGAGLLLMFARPLFLLAREWSLRRQRRQLLFVFLGFLCASPFLLVTIWPILPFEFDAYRYFWYGLDLRYMLLAVPLAFTFVVLRYQAFRSSHPLFVGVFILAGSALLASFGTWLLRRFYPQSLSDYKFPPFYLMMGVSMVTGIFWSTQGSWRGVFGRLLHWEIRSYAAVKRFGRRVTGQTDLAILPDTIASALVSELALEQAAVWLWHPQKECFQLAADAGPPQSTFPRQLPASAARLPSMTGPLRLHVPGRPPPDWLQGLQQTNTVEVVVPLWVAERLIGLLALGKRWDEEIFDERDLEIIELIAQQAALFILAALQVDELRQVPRRMAEAQERERYKIAQELHDTIQQFLGRLPFYLEVSRSAARTRPQETERLLEQSIAGVEQAARTVRQIRHNLAPSQLEKGMVQPLKELVARFQHRTGIETTLALPAELDQRLSLEARHALYRLVQQSLDNVAAHAQATLVQIELAQIDGDVAFTVIDNGRGCSQVERQRAQRQGSFGLLSMQARIDSVGGKFHFYSAPGQGTTVTGRLPARR